ncbi:MAG TPA: spore germination protein [Firmicutes bacterium]|nr:spore germination protein [Bacillota bacterium]
MFAFIKRKLTFLKKGNQFSEAEKATSATKPQFPTAKISQDLSKNFELIHTIFDNSNDLVIRRFPIGICSIEAMVVNLNGMSEIKLINDNIIGSLMKEAGKVGTPKQITLKYLKNSAINLNAIQEIDTMDEAVSAILNGDTTFFIDGENKALAMNTRTWAHRGVQEPETEPVVRGSREGFTETLSISISQIRRKIKDPELHFESIRLGRRTQTEVCVVYIRNIANPKIVEEVWRRLKKINIDAVLESGYLEEFIQDAPFSIFPTVGNTETPDKFAAKILEGRVGILVEGTPFALTVPFLFIESFQVAEDYYSRSFFTSLIRLLRFLALHITIALPALYVAIITFHPNIVPETLLLAISRTREGVPFPAFVEALLMGIFYEIFREGAVRMPRAVGQAVSIVGALILGEAAVNAGIISPIMVIVTGLTAVTGFLLPPQTDSITLLRIPLLVIASFFGLFGIIWSYIFIVIHLASLRSFGAPYFSPIMPLTFADLKDSFLRLPWWMMKTRPRVIDWQGSSRMEEDLQPEPPKPGEHES